MNDKIYIHELVNIRGHNRAAYVQHIAANWSPWAQKTRNQLCYGVWSVVGSTGTWPQVVNMWEEQGWEGLAASFGGELVGPGAQDPALARWWARAAEFRHGGFDRLVEPAVWSRPIEDLCAEHVPGVCYAHEIVDVRPGANWEHLEYEREHVAAELEHFGWRLIGAFCTAMVADDECILIWAIPSWEAWAAAEKAGGRERVLRRHDSAVRGRHRMLLVDAPLSPMATGRQPAESDRVDWEDP